MVRLLRATCLFLVLGAAWSHDQQPVVMLDLSYTDSETAHGVPELDNTMQKSQEAAKLAIQAGDALKDAEKASSVARSIREAKMVAQAKVKSSAALVAVAQKNYDDAQETLEASEKASAQAKASLQDTQQQWGEAKKHEKSTVVVSAKSMKEESEVTTELNKMRAEAILTAKQYDRALKEDRLAKHAYQIATRKSAASAKKSAELAESAHQALDMASEDDDAETDGQRERAATQSALATKEGERASQLAHEAASVGKYAADAATKAADAHSAKKKAEKMLKAIEVRDKAMGEKVQTAIKVAVKAKKKFEKIDGKLNGKDGSTAAERVATMDLAEAHATADAALQALSNAKLELKVASDKFTKLDSKSQEADSQAEAAKASARASSKAASIASKSAAEMAAKAADTAQIPVSEQVVEETAPGRKKLKTRRASVATQQQVLLGQAREIGEITRGDLVKDAERASFGLDPM